MNTEPAVIPGRALARALVDLTTPLAITAQVPTFESQRYGEISGSVAPLADCYLPPGPGPHPSVVLFHGGGFVIGSRRMKAMRYLSTRLVDAGYAAVTFDYPLLFRGGNAEGMLASTDALLRWWREKGQVWGISPAPPFAIGLSAGASLMLMTAARLPGMLSAMAAFFGVYDFENLRGPLARIMCRRLFGTNAGESLRAYSPTHSLVPADLLLLHGDDDRLVPMQQTFELAERRKHAGLPTELKIYAGAPHGFLNHPRWGVAETAIADVIDFLQSRPAP